MNEVSLEYLKVSFGSDLAAFDPTNLDVEVASVLKFRKDVLRLTHVNECSCARALLFNLKLFRL